MTKYVDSGYWQGGYIAVRWTDEDEVPEVWVPKDIDAKVWQDVPQVSDTWTDKS